MKKQLPVGLVIEGNVTHSALLRLPGIAPQLGPIKSTEVRVARRFSNLLGGGYPVPGYADVSGTRLLLVRVADAAIARVVEELAASSLHMEGLKIALCETWLPSSCAQALQQRGASVATAVALQTAGQKWFALEGDTAAVRQTRALLRTGEAQTVEVRDKELCYAAEALARTGISRILNGSREAFRHAGLNGKLLQTLLEAMTERTLGEFLNGSQSLRSARLSDVADAYLAKASRTFPAIAEQLALLRKATDRRGEAKAAAASATLK